MKLTVFVKDGFKKYFLAQPIDRMNKHTTITLTNATVYWKFNNILKEDIVKYGDAIHSMNNTLDLEQGYWTFDMLQREFFAIGTDIAKSRHNHKCTIVSSKYMDLGNFGPLLGFDKDKIINPFVPITSHESVNVNLGLKYLKINCDAINSNENKSDEGYRCKTLAYLPVTSEQVLNGSVVHFSNLNSVATLSNGCINNMEFSVMSNIPNPVSVDVLLDLYVK